MTLVRYLCTRFLRVFVVALLFFTMVLVLVDLFMNLWRFIAQNVPASQIFTIMGLYIPKAVSFGLPLAVLFSVSYTLSELYAKNELTVVFASGIPLINFTFPLLVLSIGLTFASFYFEDRIVVPTYHKKESLQKEVLHEVVSKNTDNVVIITDSGNTVYKANYYDDTRKALYGLYVVHRLSDKQVAYIIHAQSAVWQKDDGIWKLYDYVVYEILEKKLVIKSKFDNLKLDEPPETFQKNIVSVEEVSVEDAQQYIAYLRRAGLPYSEALSQYYKKFSFPFIIFIVVFLSIGLSGKTQKNVLLMSLLSCIGAAVSYYVAQMVTMLLAQFEYISPVMGAWFPVIVYTIISIVLLRYTRT